MEIFIYVISGFWKLFRTLGAGQSKILWNFVGEVSFCLLDFYYLMKLNIKEHNNKAPTGKMRTKLYIRII